MVMTSSQIAQINGMYQQMGMQQMQSASMLGMASAPNAGENIMGQAMNIGTAAGGPLVAGAMMLKGWDPFSMGIGGAMKGFGAGGLAGGIAGGIAGAAAPMLPIMAAQYGVEQMMQGAQQRQMLNSALRQSFTFQNQYGGRGFSQDQMGQIGTHLRGMTGMSGPGGEMVGMSELTRMAANMGQMGMANGVRDAQQFAQRFSEMMKAAKEIATTMNTSLEQAQQMMSSMRGSGVFGASKSAQYASMIREAADMGNLATSEVTSMMNIGSQISRSFGGRGRAGAAAGIRTIGQIGGALQAGVLNEEDIYESTGLTGAEGRRAFAVQQLQTTGNFFRKQAGRAFLAGMVNKEGNLDESAVEEIMAGGATTDSARRRAHAMGGARFLRDEGRIRGQAMARFGGLAPVIALKGILAQRGVDLTADSDRAMLFTQRYMGVGTEEAERMVRMAQQLPQIMERREEAAMERRFSEQADYRRRNSGIEGVKRKLESARAEVQKTLQKAGDDFMGEGEEMINRFINGLTDQYLQVHHKGVVSLFNSAMKGDQTSINAFSGKVEGLSRGMQSRVDAGLGALGGGRGRLEDFKRMDAERFKKAGYSVNTGSEQGLNYSLANLSEGASRFSRALAGEGEGAFGDYGRANAAAINRAMAGGDLSAAKGEAGLAGFQKMLNKTNASLADKFRAAHTKEQLEMAGNMLAGADVNKEAAENLLMPPEARAIGSTQYRTERERNEALGRMMFGERGVAGMGVGALTDRMRIKEARNLGQAFGDVFGIGGLLFKGEHGADIFEVATRAIGGIGGRGAMTEKEAGEVAGALGTEEMFNLGQRLFGSEADSSRATREVQKELQGLASRAQMDDESKFTATDQTRFNALQSLSAMKRLSDLEKQYPNGIPDHIKDEVEGEFRDAKTGEKRSFDEIARMGAGAGIQLQRGEQERRDQIATDVGREARKKVDIMRGKGGLLDMSGSVKKDILAKMSKNAGAFVESMAKKSVLMARLEHASPEQRAGIMEELGKTAEGGAKSLDEMSPEEAMSAARGLQGAAGAGDLRSTLMRHGTTARLLARGGTGARGMLLAGRQMGLRLGARDLGDIQSALKSGGTEGVVQQFAEKMGIDAGAAGKDTDLGTKLRDVIGAVGSGKGMAAAGAIDRLMSSPEMQDQQRKQQLAKQKEQDPLQAQMNDHMKGVAEESKKQTKLLSMLNTKTEKAFEGMNAEKKEGEG